MLYYGREIQSINFEHIEIKNKTTNRFDKLSQETKKELSTRRLYK